MAIKQVKNYYKQVEKMYLELLSDLKEMEEDFKNNECTEEELQNLLIPVRGIEENYKRLSYIMYLLNILLLIELSGSISITSFYLFSLFLGRLFYLLSFVEA